jgi:hypothetical protein
MSITKQHTQEALSLAFIHAVSGIAGLNVQIGARHDYGVDGTLRAVVVRDGRRIESGVLVDFQLKASHNWSLVDDHIVYDLEVKTYNDLVTREPDTPTFILVLLCMPKLEADWISTDEQCLTLRNCCYWVTLSGPPSENKTRKRIHIPRQNVLTPLAMGAILAAERSKMLGDA